MGCPINALILSSTLPVRNKWPLWAERELQMLVLSRRERESIVIGNGIVVTVLAVKGKTVRLGIDAPPEVVVHRQEVQRRIASEA